MYKSVKDTGRIPDVNERVFIYDDPKFTGAMVGKFIDYEPTTLRIVLDAARSQERGFRSEEVYTFADNNLADVSWTRPMDVIGNLRKAAEMIRAQMTPQDDAMDFANAKMRVRAILDAMCDNSEYVVDMHDAAALSMLLTVAERGMIPSTADGSIRSLLIDNANKGKFGDIKIDENKSTLHILVHVLEHLLRPPVRIWYYDAKSPQSEEAVKKAAMEACNRTNLMIPRTVPSGGVEFVDISSGVLTTHSCGFYNGPAANYCAGCGQVLAAFWRKKAGVEELPSGDEPVNNLGFTRREMDDAFAKSAEILEAAYAKRVARKTGLPCEVVELSMQYGTPLPVELGEDVQAGQLLAVGDRGMLWACNSQNPKGFIVAECDLRRGEMIDVRTGIKYVEESVLKHVGGATVEQQLAKFGAVEELPPSGCQCKNLLAGHDATCHLAEKKS